MSRNFQPKHGATKLLLSVLETLCKVILIVALFFVSLALVFASFLWMIGLGYKASTVTGPAPDGDYNTRRKWGEQHLGPYLASAESWIKGSAKIEKDIGEVTGVAPIRWPNKHGASFGESGTDLNLQVIGTQGEGFLRLEEYNWGGRSGQADWQEVHWWVHKRTVESSR